MWSCLVICAALVCLAGCASPATAPYSNDAARFTLHLDQIVTRGFVGFGGEMNPYLYATPNWAGTAPTTRPAQGVIDDQNVGELERRVIELAPQHVRIFVQTQWWDPAYDDYIAHRDPRMVESFLRTVRLAQRAGATVNLTFWHGPWPRPEEAGRQFARLIDDLVNRHGLTCIRYATIQNEPNNPQYTKDAKRVRKMPFQTYDALYLAFDEELRRLGSRDRIDIISGDLVGDDQREWFDHLGSCLAQVSDGYSMHAYWDYTDAPKLVRRLTEVRQIVDAMPPGQRRPIYCTEFGVRGDRQARRVEPGDLMSPDGTRTPVADTIAQAVQIARFDVLAVRLGYRAAVQWELYDAWYDRLMPYGLIGDVTRGFATKPAYELLRLLTHTTRPGWDIVRIDGEDDDTTVAALRGPDGAFSVLALNHGEHARKVAIDGLPADVQLHRVVWNPSGDARLSKADDVRTSQRTELALPGSSLTALTTLDWNPAGP